MRGKPENFAEHYNQAALFFNSQTPVERAHIIGAFRFELTRSRSKAISQLMVSGLRNASKEMAAALAASRGLDLPDAMPRAIDVVPALEVEAAPSWSLAAISGEAGVTTRKVAIMVADGVVGATITQAIEALTGAGAVTRLLSTRLGFVADANGERFEVDAALEKAPAVLFDALILRTGGRRRGAL